MRFLDRQLFLGLRTVCHGKIHIIDMTQICNIYDCAISTIYPVPTIHEQSRAKQGNIARQMRRLGAEPAIDM